MRVAASCNAGLRVFDSHLYSVPPHGRGVTAQVRRAGAALGCCLAEERLRLA